jgi:DNA-directed RNA polymerase subunit omega
MARITVEDCLDKENNRFALVLLASKRAKQLLEGAELLIPNTKNKAVVNALREIAAGKVRPMSDEDLKIKREKEAREKEELLAKEKEARVEIPTNGHQQITKESLFFDTEDDSDDDDLDDEE